jgi:hypothetical protein
MTAPSPIHNHWLAAVILLLRCAESSRQYVELDSLIGNSAMTLSPATPVGFSQPLKAFPEEQDVLLRCSLAGTEHSTALAAGVTPLRSQKPYSGSTAGVYRLDFRSASSHLDPKMPGYYLNLLRAGLHHRLLRDTKAKKPCVIESVNGPWHWPRPEQRLKSSWFRCSSGFPSPTRGPVRQTGCRTPNCYELF